MIALIIIRNRIFEEISFFPFFFFRCLATGQVSKNAFVSKEAYSKTKSKQQLNTELKSIGLKSGFLFCNFFFFFLLKKKKIRDPRAASRERRKCKWRAARDPPLKAQSSMVRRRI